MLLDVLEYKFSQKNNKKPKNRLIKWVCCVQESQRYRYKTLLLPKTLTEERPTAQRSSFALLCNWINVKMKWEEKETCCGCWNTKTPSIPPFHSNSTQNSITNEIDKTRHQAKQARNAMQKEGKEARHAWAWNCEAGDGDGKGMDIYNTTTTQTNPSNQTSTQTVQN